MRPLLKKVCEHCSRSFLTRDDSLVFCNTDCESKYTYSKKKGIPPKEVNLKKCLNCGDEGGLKYCNEQCKKEYIRARSISEINKKDKVTVEKSKKLPSYIISGKIERSRVFRPDTTEYYIRGCTKY